MTDQRQQTQPDPVTLALGLGAFIPVLGFVLGLCALINGRHHIQEAGRHDRLVHTTTAVGMALAAVGIVLWAVLLLYFHLDDGDSGSSYETPRCDVAPNGAITGC